MAGICFGHQLIAQALGGTVRKSEKGWGIGRHVYDVVPGNGVIDGETDRDRRFASGPGHRATHRRNNDIPFGVHAARGTSLCQRHGDVGAAASRIHGALCAYLLRESRPERRSRKPWSQPPRPRWISRSTTPTSAARSRAFWQGRATREPIPSAYGSTVALVNDRRRRAMHPRRHRPPNYRGCHPCSASPSYPDEMRRR